MTSASPAKSPCLQLALLLALAPVATAFAQQTAPPPAQGQSQTDDRSPQTADPIRPARPLPGEQPAFVDARELFGPDAATNKPGAEPVSTPASDPAATTKALGDLPPTPPTGAPAAPADPASAPATADIPTRPFSPQEVDPALANLAPDTTSDPPTRAGRIALLEGAASFQAAGQADFTPAELNFPITTGDRLYAAPGSRVALEAGTVSLRLGSATDLSVTALDDTASHFGMALGSLHLRTLELDENAPVELDTPTASLTVLAPGDLRIDVDRETGATTLSVLSGEVEVFGVGDFDKTFATGQSVRLTLPDPQSTDTTLQAEALDPPAVNALDGFSQQLDTQLASADQSQAEAIDNRTIGAADLADNGDWTADSTYGIVWYPRGVTVDWQPYRNGHWAWVKPWGWTWIAAEPWGFAPFHYGRWAHVNGRWGWVPGPRGVRPVWAPALVGFVGGDRFAAQIGYRGGVAGWFPLAPNEPYTPPYKHSALYANRVNIANLYTRDSRSARSVYNQRKLNAAYAADQKPTFANFAAATVVPEAVFSSGRSVAQNAVPLQNGDLETATLLTHPGAKPTREVGLALDTRALPPRLDRPIVFTHAITTNPAPPVEHPTGPRPVVASMQPAPEDPSAPIERRDPVRPVHPAQPEPTTQPAPQRPQGYVPVPNPRPTPAELPPAQLRPAPQQTTQPRPQPQQLPPDREYQP